MQSPHDTLFGFTFRHPHHAAGWLRSVLPEPLTAAIDWPRLAPLRERFPDARLRPHLADAGFVAPLRTADGEHDVLLLPEHKSYADPAVAQQLLRYSIHLQRALQQRPDSPPLVLPVLLRHGFTDRPAAAAAASRSDLPFGLLAAQPRQQIFVDDIDQQSDAAIAAREQSPLATLTLLCLKSLRDASTDETTRFFERWQHLLRAVDRVDSPPDAPPLGPDATDAFGWYALAVTNVDSLALSDIFCRILQREDISIMSTLERTFQKGIAQGKAEGKAEGKVEGRAELVLRMLRRRFGDAVTQTIESRVRSANLDDLDRFGERLLDAATIGDVFSDPA